MVQGLKRVSKRKKSVKARRSPVKASTFKQETKAAKELELRINFNKNHKTENSNQL